MIMRYLIVATFIITLISCDKTELAQKTEIDPSGKALVKLGYFSPYSTPTNTFVHSKIDDIRLTNTFQYPIAYPGGGFNMGGNSFADYLAIEAGTKVIKVSIPKTGTNTDSVSLFTGSITLTADTRQTIMITDTMANTQATVISDDVTIPTGNLTARGKFFNGIPNAGALDLYIRTPTGVINPATNIEYKKVSNYFEFTAGIGNDTFQIVKTGQAYTGFSSPNVLATYIFTTSGFGRVYTILSRGYVLTPASTTDLRRPQVSLIVNR